MLATGDLTTGFGAAFRRYRQVMLALMLRNIRTRFFGHGLGYLVALAWPLVHTLLIVALLGANGRIPPIGDSMVLFVATGAAPYQALSYLATFMMFSVIQSRPLFAFPEVKVLDALLSAALLEIVSSFCVSLLLILIGLAYGVDLFPRNVEEAAAAYGAAILMGVGLGLLNGVLALAMPLWGTIFMLLRIVSWMVSGAVFLPDALIEPYRTIQAYNPIAQVVEWMRVAYYDGLGAGFLDRAYTIKFGLACCFLGLVLERLTRGHLLALR